MSELDSVLDSIIGNAEDQSKQQEKKPDLKSKKSDKNDHMELIKKLSDKIAALEKSLEVKKESDAGNPGNEWAKKVAQEKANRKAKPTKTIYSIKDGKVLKIDVKTNGAYSSYIGNNKKHKQQLMPLILQWKKEGVWIDEYECEEKVSEIMLELQLQGE